MELIQQDLLKLHYGNRFENKLIETIIQDGIYKSIKQGEVLMDFGLRVSNMPLLLSGAIKILRRDEEGHELLLYFLEKGDTCAMTLTCCLGDAISQIKAETEMDTELVLIPIQRMEDWLIYKTWRDFVFESYNARLYEMLDVIDNLAFNNMNERLIKYLQNKVLLSKNSMLTISHQDIAADLNTSRVVISRLLKQFEKDGKVILHRNRLELR